MRSDPLPASLGARDVIAAWLICLAFLAAVFVYPLIPASRRQPVAHAGAAATPPQCAGVLSGFDSARG
jgi:hypothetical protein